MVPLARVYVDPTAIVLASGPENGAGEASPGAAEAIRHLVDAGLDVVLLAGDTPHGLEHLPPEVQLQPTLPERLEPGTWFLTGEPNGPFGRPRGGRTVLVGPKRPPGRVPLPRFDLEARDLPSAVMEILTRQAMA